MDFLSGAVGRVARLISAIEPNRYHKKEFEHSKKAREDDFVLEKEKHQVYMEGQELDVLTKKMEFQKLNKKPDKDALLMKAVDTEDLEALTILAKCADELDPYIVSIAYERAQEKGNAAAIKLIGLAMKNIKENKVENEKRNVNAPTRNSHNSSNLGLSSSRFQDTTDRSNTHQQLSSQDAAYSDLSAKQSKGNIVKDIEVDESAKSTILYQSSIDAIISEGVVNENFTVIPQFRLVTKIQTAVNGEKESMKMFIIGKICQLYNRSQYKNKLRENLQPRQEKISNGENEQDIDEDMFEQSSVSKLSYVDFSMLSDDDVDGSNASNITTTLPFNASITSKGSTTLKKIKDELKDLVVPKAQNQPEPPENSLAKVGTSGDIQASFHPIMEQLKDCDNSKPEDDNDVRHSSRKSSSSGSINSFICESTKNTIYNFDTESAVPQEDFTDVTMEKSDSLNILRIESSDANRSYLTGSSGNLLVVVDAFTLPGGDASGSFQFSNSDNQVQSLSASFSPESIEDSQGSKRTISNPLHYGPTTLKETNTPNRHNNLLQTTDPVTLNRIPKQKHSLTKQDIDTNKDISEYSFSSVSSSSGSSYELSSRNQPPASFGCHIDSVSSMPSDSSYESSNKIEKTKLSAQMSQEQPPASSGCHRDSVSYMPSDSSYESSNEIEKTKL